MIYIELDPGFGAEVIGVYMLAVPRVNEILVFRGRGEKSYRVLKVEHHVSKESKPDAGFHMVGLKVQELRE